MNTPPTTTRFGTRRALYSGLAFVATAGILSTSAAFNPANAVPLETTSTTTVFTKGPGPFLPPDVLGTVGPAKTLVPEPPTTPSPPTPPTTPTTQAPTTPKQTFPTIPKTTIAATTTVKANVKPVAQSGALIVRKDRKSPLILVALDPDQQPLTFAIVAQPQHGRITGTAPNLVYQPTKGFTGVDAVTFVASDGQSQSDPGIITVTVTGSSKGAKSAPAKTCAKGKKTCK
jgi:Bacterial Ig domain